VARDARPGVDAARALPPHVLAAIARGRGEPPAGTRDPLKGAPPEAAKAVRRNKYGVSPPEERTVRGILFASKAEARRFEDLELLRRGGAVRFFLRQVPFHLPGGVTYRLDFLVFWADGRTTFEDVKGKRTELYRVKKRQVEELYPVRIDELT